MIPEGFVEVTEGKVCSGDYIVEQDNNGYESFAYGYVGETISNLYKNIKVYRNVIPAALEKIELNEDCFGELTFLEKNQFILCNNQHKIYDMLKTILKRMT